MYFLIRKCWFPYIETLFNLIITLSVFITILIPILYFASLRQFDFNNLNSFLTIVFNLVIALPIFVIKLKLILCFAGLGLFDAISMTITF